MPNMTELTRQYIQYCFWWVAALLRGAARRDVFGYIEMFYSSTGKHTNDGLLSLFDIEI